MNIKKLMLLLVASTTLSLNAFEVFNETEEPIRLSGFKIRLENASQLSFNHSIVLEANTIMYSEDIVLDLIRQGASVASLLSAHQFISQGLPHINEMVAHGGCSNSLFCDRLYSAKRIVFFKDERGELQVRHGKSSL